jgi:hypothetical protein
MLVFAFPVLIDVVLCVLSAHEERPRKARALFLLFGLLSSHDARVNAELFSDFREADRFPLQCIQSKQALPPYFQGSGSSTGEKIGRIDE